MDSHEKLSLDGATVLFRATSIFGLLRIPHILKMAEKVPGNGNVLTLAAAYTDPPSHQERWGQLLRAQKSDGSRVRSAGIRRGFGRPQTNTLGLRRGKADSAVAGANITPPNLGRAPLNRRWTLSVIFYG